MRIIFAGTPAFSTETLSALLSSEHEICAAYTQPDRPSGRGRKLTPSPVKLLAIEHNIAIEQAVNFKEADTRQTLANYKAEIMIVTAYGLLLPQSVLDTPALGCINIHASLLPRWRGAAPIQRAILAGDAKTGVSIMQMEAGLDTGPVLAQAECQIQPDDTAQSLHDRLAKLGAQTLLNTLPNIVELQRHAKTQEDHLTCYAAKLQKQEAEIDWQQSAAQIARQINAFNPYPIAQTRWQEKVFRIWLATPLAKTSKARVGNIIAIERQSIDVATGDGTLRLHRVQLPGKRAISVADFLNANTPVIGEQLG